MTRIKSIPILQTSKVLGTLHFILGAVVSCLGLIVMAIVTTESPVVNLTALVALPVCAGLVGFGGTALACWLYNQVAQWMGGIQVDLEEESVASQPQSEEEYADKLEGQFSNDRQTELKSVSSFRLKPNPVGKERNQGGSLSPDQLGGEWLDIRNDGAKSVSLRGVSLYHLAPASVAGGKPNYRLVVSLPDFSLKPGEVLRLHAGQPRELSVLNSEDRTGANWHSFTGEDAYVWNIREGDTCMLYEMATKATIDSTSYPPHPPEGVVLHRQGPMLIPARVAAGGYR